LVVVVQAEQITVEVVAPAAYAKELFLLQQLPILLL
jgi:hypothetical protein